MSDLYRKVALITGSGNGMTEGIARGLGEAGATVYIDRGDEPVDTLLRRIIAEQGHLDILVNCVCGEYEHMVENGDFAASYAASRLVAETMAAQHSGLIVHIPFWAGQQHGQQHTDESARANLKVATEWATTDMAQALREYNVAVVSLYPGVLSTESVLQSADLFGLSDSGSPQFVGRAVAALAADPNLLENSGRSFDAAQLAQEYKFTDVDGERPKSPPLDTA
jgi:NAD(P)-dependent dehydrogenase (short-subunit alcohol dehydrogenase family)